MFQSGHGWVRGGYTCQCREGFYSATTKNEFNGSLVEVGARTMNMSSLTWKPCLLSTRVACKIESSNFMPYTTLGPPVKRDKEQFGCCLPKSGSLQKTSIVWTSMTIREYQDSEYFHDQHQTFMERYIGPQITEIPNIKEFIKKHPFPSESSFKLTNQFETDSQ